MFFLTYTIIAVFYKYEKLSECVISNEGQKKEHPLGYSSAHDWLLIFGGYVATDLATFDTE